METLTDNLISYSFKQEIGDIYIKDSPTTGCKPNMAYCLLWKAYFIFEIVECKSEEEEYLMTSETVFKF